MTTSGMGAVTPTDVKNILEELNKNLGLPDNSKVTSTPVLCKDGTTKSQTNDPNVRVLDACRDNGGRAEKQPVVVKQQNLLAPSEVKLTAEDKFYEMLGIKYSGGSGSGWGLQSRPVGRLLVAVVLVAGYFAYKKSKK